jgi:hypothetical protein
MLMSFGVKLSLKKAEILDMSEQMMRGRGGIDIEALSWIFYPGVSKMTARDRIKSHVCQINDMLVSTDWHIVNESGISASVRCSRVR